MRDRDKMTPTERAALAVFVILNEHGLTTRQVADVLGVSTVSARSLLNRISRVVPLCLMSGRWQIVSDSDLGQL